MVLRDIPSEADLRCFLTARLADFKVPSRILFVPEIPKSAAGKVQRLKLADTLLGRRGRRGNEGAGMPPCAAAPHNPRNENQPPENGKAVFRDLIQQKLARIWEQIVMARQLHGISLVSQYRLQGAPGETP